MKIIEHLHFGLGRRLPIILQAEAAECGLACLAMVAGYHGRNVGLLELRKQFPMSLKGMSLARLIEMAGQMQLSARPLRLEVEELVQLKRPCILHWNMSHFVLLKSVSRHGITIHDPGLGARTISFDEVSRHFTGVALELSPTPDFSRAKPASSIRIAELIGPISGLFKGLVQILAFSIGLQLLLLLTPFYMQWTVDQALVAGDRELLAVLGIGFLFVALFHVVIGALRSWAVVYLSTSLGVQWNVRVLRHLLRLPQDWFEKRHIGDVVSRMGATASIQRTLSTSFVEAVIDGLMGVVTLVMMFLYSPTLAFMTLGAVVAYFVVRALAYRPVRIANEQQITCAARQQSHLLESIRGIQTLKLTGSEESRRVGWQNLYVETANRELHLSKLGIGFSSLSSTLFGIERVAVIWVGALLALDGLLSVGMLIAYVAYKDQFANRMNSLIDKWIEFRMLRMHAERLSDIVLSEPDTALSASAVLATPRGNSITVKNASFRYAEGEPWVVSECSFRVEEGESLAIVGASGCGKTTLAKMILGLLRPSSGAIEIGGVDLSRWSKEDFRRRTAAVMQDDQLFAGSVLDNICFMESETDADRAIEAAKLAGIHEEIERMPMGYNTLIGDMGTALSGGQKQRIVLARALYRKPDILVLDEATSHLDVERERLVNDAVKRLAITRIIIAHRPETIASADRVLVMAGGRIVQEVRPDCIVTTSNRARSRSEETASACEDDGRVGSAA